MEGLKGLEGFLVSEFLVSGFLVSGFEGFLCFKFQGLKGYVTRLLFLNELKEITQSLRTLRFTKYKILRLLVEIQF